MDKKSIFLPDGNDFIIPGRDSEFEKDSVLALMSKYEIFCDKNDLENLKNNRPSSHWVGFIENDYFSSDLEKDIENISKIISSLGGKCHVRHCYDPDGEGYFAINNENTKRYVASEYRLSRSGAVWSYMVWRRLFFANAVLMVYLNRLKEALIKRYPETEMEIRPLYLSYIDSDFIDDITELPYKDELKEVKEMFLKENAGYLKERDEYSFFYYGDNLGWYNSRENSSYFTVKTVLNDAIDAFYERREILEQEGLWDEVNKVIYILNDIRYKRGMFRKNGEKRNR